MDAMKDYGTRLKIETALLLGVLCLPSLGLFIEGKIGAGVIGLLVVASIPALFFIMQYVETGKHPWK